MRRRLPPARSPVDSDPPPFRPASDPSPGGRASRVTGDARHHVVVKLLLVQDASLCRASLRHHGHALGGVTLQGHPSAPGRAFVRTPRPVASACGGRCGSRHEPGRGFSGELLPPRAGSNEKGAAVHAAAPFEATRRSATALPGQRPRAMIPSWISIYVVVPAMNWLRFEPEFACPYSVAWLNCARAS